MADNRKPTPAEEYERVLVPGMFIACTRLLLDHARPHPAERVLDLACGSGIVALTVAPMIGVGGSVVAVDSTPGMLAVARARPAPGGAPIEWVEGDATALDLPDHSFDLVLCQQGLQFFPDRPAALAEVKRVLADGGRAAFALWRSRERQPLFDPMCEAEIRHLAPLGVTRADVDAFVSLGDAAEIRGLLADAGFADVAVTADTVEADFDAATFVRDAEYGYSAFMPQFREDPSAFDAYVAAVEADMAPVLARYRTGDRLRFPVPVQIAMARS
jgi:ubiquinone/menaquinone biosynthesis C-methylase UbiE